MAWHANFQRYAASDGYLVLSKRGVPGGYVSIR
jgi:transcriptional regulator CtsR